MRNEKRKEIEMKTLAVRVTQTNSLDVKPKRGVFYEF